MFRVTAIYSNSWLKEMKQWDEDITEYEEPQIWKTKFLGTVETLEGNRKDSGLQHYKESYRCKSTKWIRKMLSESKSGNEKCDNL